MTKSYFLQKYISILYLGEVGVLLDTGYCWTARYFSRL